MPRETVPHHPSDGQFEVHVGWSRDEHMQLGITTPDAGAGHHHLVDHFYGQPAVLEQIGRDVAARLSSDGGELAAALHAAEQASSSDSERTAFQHAGRQVLDAVTGSGEGPSTGLWWTPTRFQVNTLIRLLRKARDAAMGRDE